MLSGVIILSAAGPIAPHQSCLCPHPPCAPLVALAPYTPRRIRRKLVKVITENIITAKIKSEFYATSLYWQSDTNIDRKKAKQANDNTTRDLARDEDEVHFDALFEPVPSKKPK